MRLRQAMHLFQPVQALVDLAWEELLFLAQVTLNQPQRPKLAVQLIGQQKRAVLNITAVAVADRGGIARNLAIIRTDSLAPGQYQHRGAGTKKGQQLWQFKALAL